MSHSTAFKSLTLGVAAAMTLALAACGSSNDKKSSAGKQAQNSKIDVTTKGKKGGQLTFVAAGDVDYIDPGQTYYTFGFMVEEATQRNLYSFLPNDSTKAVPDLASGPPEISADNKTLTIHIRKGVKFSPPVNREVTSKDIKYAIERAFSKNVPSGYAGVYFNTLVGAPKAGTSDIKEIPGIETPDDYTLVLKLSEPQAPLVSQALVMPITAPVPKEYASKYDAKVPSTYDQYTVFTGPYMVKNDASGKLTGRKAGKDIQLVRNPNWTGTTTGDFRPAYVDSVDIQEGNTDLEVASRRALEGQSLLCCDSGSPPAPVLKEAVTRYKSQIFYVPSGGTRYIALNTTVKPFDNINIRKAVIASFDRNALRLTRGGALLGDIANGWLPPGIPGFEEAGGLKQGTDNDFMASPTGNPAVAKKYMLLAKQDGEPVSADGKWTGSDKLLTIATNADPGKKTAEVAQNEFQKLGFKLNFRIVPQDTLYTKFCGVPKAKVAICPNVGWFKDFTDPESMLEPTFDGKAIKPAGNVNWSQLNDPAINKAMADAALKQGEDRYKAWANVNKMIVAQAPGIPYSWDASFQLESKDVQSVMDPYNTTWSLSFTSLK
jgi:peptide/nickel transport system substrate-binding protein